MERITQHQLIVEYVKEFGFIIPAKMYGYVYRGQMMGSELSRRCRELRAKGILQSEGEGKFQKFYLGGKNEQIPMEHKRLLDEGRTSQPALIDVMW
jgi:hypothetical protein